MKKWPVKASFVRGGFGPKWREITKWPEQFLAGLVDTKWEGWESLKVAFVAALNDIKGGWIVRRRCGETAGAEGGRSNAVHVAGGHVVRRRHEGVVSASARWGSGPRSADENPFGEEQLGW